MLTSERCHTVNISSRHDTYSVKIEKLSEPEATFQICFWYFISFSIKKAFMKIFKMKLALNMTVLLHNIPWTDQQDTDFEKTTT